ncbi:MAG: hypothetical protein AB2693_27780 [Candidatus Thiodiazotropha sp.]
MTLPKSVHVSSPEHQETRQSESYKQQLKTQMKENKQLQDTFKDIMSQSKLFKCENEKLQKSLVALQKENEALKANFLCVSEKLKDSEKQSKALKAQISKDTAKSLV